MKTRLLRLVILIVFAVISFAGITYAQVGPVVSVSQNQNSLPPTVNNFLSTYYPGANPTNIQLLTLQNAYQITMSNGVTLNFDQNSGRWLQVLAAANPISQIVVFNLLPGSIYNDLSRNALTYSVLQMTFTPNQGYSIQTQNNATYNYDVNGVSLGGQ